MFDGHKILRIPFSEGSPFSRPLLIKQHASKVPEEQKYDERTLFVAHIDYWVTKPALWKCFLHFGPLEQIQLSRGVRKKGECVCFAHIRFRGKESVQAALNCPPGFAPTTMPMAREGSVKERTKAIKTRYPDPAELQAEVDEFMANFEIEESRKKRENTAQVVDEDGFTVVKSGVSHAPDGTRIVSFNAPKHTEWSKPGALKAKKNKTELSDFYGFQVKQNKVQSIEQERKRKREDEEEIERMKKRGQFSAI